MDVIKYLSFIALSILILFSTSCGERIEENALFCDNKFASIPANVIDENPINEDSGIIFTSDLSSLGMEVSLTDLDNSCLLRNKAIEISEDSLYPNNIASTTFDLKTDPSHPYFQQVNSYYYANKLYKEVIDVGASLNGIRQLSIDAHCDYLYGAYFSFNLNTICLGYAPILDSETTLWAADDSDVILHEFGHAINHNLASQEHFSLSTESYALDEAIADYWAMTSNNEPVISEWFLGYISNYFRDGRSNHKYPQDIVAQPHRDGRIFMEALWSIREQLGKEITDSITIRILQLLERDESTYAKATQTIIDSTSSLGLTDEQKEAVEIILKDKGLYREDSAAGLMLSNKTGRNTYYVIDDHHLSLTANGNCDGGIDMDETVLLLVNLALPGGTAIGMGKANLVINTATSGIEVHTGGSLAYYLRLGKTEKDFVDVLENIESDLISAGLPEASRRTSTDRTIIQASFLVTATSAGSKAMTVRFEPINGDTVEVPVTVVVGEDPNRRRDCSGTGRTRKDSLWEVWK